MIIERLTKGNPPIPINEMVTNCHDVPNRIEGIERFIHSFIKYTKTHIGIMLVVDFSCAEIIVGLLAFKNMFVGDYLRAATDLIEGKWSLKQIK